MAWSLQGPSPLQPAPTRSARCLLGERSGALPPCLCFAGDQVSQPIHSSACLYVTNLISPMMLSWLAIGYDLALGRKFKIF